MLFQSLDNLMRQVALCPFTEQNRLAHAHSLTGVSERFWLGSILNQLSPQFYQLGKNVIEKLVSCLCH